MKGTKRDRLLYGVLYNICRVLGVLPVTRNIHFHFPLHICEASKDCFSPSRWGLKVTTAHIMLLLLDAYMTYPRTEYLFGFVGWLWLQAFSSALISLFLVRFHDSKNLAEFVSTACRMYTIPSKNFKPLSLIMFTLLFFYPFVVIIYRFTWFFCHKKCNLPLVLILLRIDYTDLPVLAMEVTLVISCLIAERAYMDINNKLKLHHKVNFTQQSFRELKVLLDKHVAISKFVRCLSEIFSPHLLNIFLSFALKAIINTVASAAFLKANNNFESVIAHVLYTLYLIFRMLFICSFCQKVKDQASETTAILRKLRVFWIDKLSHKQAMLLDGYEELKNAIFTEFTACGLFPINMQQVLNVLGLIITYGLFALQSDSLRA